MQFKIKKYDISEEQNLNKIVLYYCSLIVGTTCPDQKLYYSESLMQLINLNLWFLDIYPDFNKELCEKIKKFQHSNRAGTREFAKKWMWITLRTPGKDIIKAYDVRITPTSRFD